MSAWNSKSQVSPSSLARNFILVLVMFATLGVAAETEGYAALISLPFVFLLVLGFALSVWLSLRMSTARFVALLALGFFMEYTNQTIGIRSGLWQYHGKGGQYVFGVVSWLVAACSAQMMAIGIAIPILRWLRLPALKRLTWVPVVLLFAVIPLTAGTYDLTTYIQSGPDIQDWVDRAAEMSVTDGDFYGTGRNYPPDWRGATVLVHHSWRHHK